MANNGVENPENLRKQLAVAVRSVQWSYAIFWCLSPTNQGGLKWSVGFYNGDIKTRKTFQTMELNADKMGLQRSEQLKELYESLLVGEGQSETESQTKKPSSGLSPEDLSDTEWYYLVCMSFVFNQGEDLPGRALANNRTIWLCDAQYADSKVFSRSLLAKSASIQTIVCFPYLGGVIELGVTDLVDEDHSLVQHIKASLLEFSKPVCLDKLSSDHNVDDHDDLDPIGTLVGRELDTVNYTIPFENKYIEAEDMQELQGNNNADDDDFDMASLDDDSNGSDHFNQTNDSFMLDGLNCGAASQAQSWRFMEDDFSNCVQGSINSSDCISQVVVNHEKGTTHYSKLADVKNNRHINEHQKINHSKFSSLDLGTKDDLHYKRIISTVLGTSHRLSGQLLHRGHNLKSGFVGWKKTERNRAHSTRSQQGVLKKILLAVPMMYGVWSKKENGKKDWIWNDECTYPVLPEKSEVNEKFMVLRSMVPSITQLDKAAILQDTIKYVQELEARVEELESGIDLAEFDTKSRNKYSEGNEKTLENYKTRARKPWLNKRKACDIDESGAEPEGPSGIVPSNIKDEIKPDMKVIVTGQEVLIELKCAWRDYLLLEILDAINNLQLDAHSIQSSTCDGVLTLAVDSRARGSVVASAGVIKQALWKITGTR